MVNVDGLSESEIKNIADLTIFRDAIDSLDKRIVLFLNMRSKMPGNLRLYIPNLSIRMRNRGVEEVYSTITISPIYRKICNDKKNYDEKKLDEIARVDVLVQEAIKERISMGKPVAIWKYHKTSTEEITYNGREKEVLERVAAIAAENRMDKAKMVYIFKNVIMKYTKSIEHCTMNGLRMRSPVKSDVVGKTACKYILPILKASLEEVHGPCKSKTEYENGIQTYFIIPLNGGQNSSARQID